MPLSLILQHSNYYGNSGQIIEEIGELSTDLYGLSTCSMTLKTPMNRFDLVPKLFSSHPFFPYLNVERQRVRIKDGYLMITVEFAGIAGPTVPIYELCLGLGQTPIESHPNFEAFAGKPSEPLNGAFFIDPQTGKKTANDAIGVFDRFLGRLGDEVNPFAGISDFLDFSQAVWRERFYTTARPGDATTLGHIAFPEGPVPFLGPGRNWIYQSLNYEQRGLVYGVTKEWKASGFKGWNEAIYGTGF